MLNSANCHVWQTCLTDQIWSGQNTSHYRLVPKLRGSKGVLDPLFGLHRSGGHVWFAPNPFWTRARTVPNNPTGAGSRRVTSGNCALTFIHVTNLGGTTALGLLSRNQYTDPSAGTNLLILYA